MPTLSSPRFGAVFHLVGNKDDFPAAEKALREKAQAQKVPIFIRASRDYDLSIQFIQSTGKLKSFLSMLKKEEHLTQVFQETTKTEDLKAANVYTGRLDSTLGRLSAFFHGPFYALRSLVGGLVQGHTPGVQHLVREAVNALVLGAYLLATPMLGRLIVLPDLLLSARNELRIRNRKNLQESSIFSPKAVMENGFKLPR